MERIYRETTLKKKKMYVRILAGAFILAILGQCILGASKEFGKKLVTLGTNCMQPAITKFQTLDRDKVNAPFLLQMLAPAIFCYTWKEEVPAFAVINVVNIEKKDEATEPVYLAITKEEELSLIQENLYEESGDFSPQTDRPAPFTEELNTVLETENRSMLQSYDLAKYTDMTKLVKDFYVVDASTSPDAGLLNINTLTSYDCTIDKNTEGPQILIYHSHSQEGFADSIEGDVGTTIVGAGEKLSRLLEEKYGFKVLHHTGVYDVPSRDNAYSNALPAIEQVLEDNPSIQVVIDLHRDAVAEGTKLVKMIDGKNYARFMFFNGICRSTNGPISYLSNPYLQENLAFSFQAQVIAESYFSGITRKIYLKAWRYNMHLKPRNMLIELGAQTNTVEEIMNTTEILAFVINKVLSGQ